MVVRPGKRRGKNNAVYRQCKLVNGNRELVTFIEKKFAQVGKILKLQEDDGEWTQGWRVEFVGYECNESPDPQAIIRRHKRKTGDSLKW